MSTGTVAGLRGGRATASSRPGDDRAPVQVYRRREVALRLDRLALAPVRMATRSLADPAERIVDHVLAGEIPETVARSVAEHRVLERVTAEFLASDSSDELVASIVRSQAFHDALYDVVSSPELRRALAQQTSGFGGDLATAIRRSAARADAALDARLKRRPSARFAGLSARAPALVLDALLAQLCFLVLVGSLALLAALVPHLREPAFAFSGAGVAWLIAETIYFAGFWSTIGQTPGMRLLGVRVRARGGGPPSLPRAVLRFAGLLLAALPLGAGFLTVLFDKRRRALQDLIAGTTVVRARAPIVRTRERVRAAPVVLRSTYVDVAGIPVHTVAGGTGTPVVLVHGFGVSGEYMLPLARVLARGHATYVPDLPGNGKSGRPPERWGIAAMADVLGEWLDAVGLHAPVLVANSLGCQVATELAVRRPSSVGGLVLIGPTIDPSRRGARRQLFSVARDAANEPFAVLAGAARENSHTVDVRIPLVVARSALADRIEERLPRITQPAVVVYGERDGFIGRDWAERAASLLPHGRLVVVPGAPHAVHFTRPELIAELVQDLEA